MTIDEAIKELIDSLDESIPPLREQRRNPIQLGIEALKLLQHQRTYLLRAQETILLSETKD